MRRGMPPVEMRFFAMAAAAAASPLPSCFAPVHGGAGRGRDAGCVVALVLGADMRRLFSFWASIMAPYRAGGGGGATLAAAL